ncbi:diguanylate cyclase [Candidatus Saccharibacteria bacterium CG_4_10_14_0_2_um_filter_52_9]|nr:MAG: diguanylate cyclase [Candidatus Saccharibacteria bacterium CG_4_10_14_0_2_um_filter_52_9]
MPKQPAVLYDPTKTFDDNFDNGPFPLQPNETPYKNTGEPTFSFLGHQLYSPFGIAAGSLPTSKHVSYAFQRGFDVVCYKTQRSVPFPVNEFHNVVYIEVEGDLTMEKASRHLVAHPTSNKPVETITITNSFGNPSRGPDFWVEDMKQAVAAQCKGQLLIASVVGTIQPGFSQEDYYDDFSTAAALAVKTGVQAIEINLSCPNVAAEAAICYTYDAVLSIAKKVRSVIGDTPLIAKIGYFTGLQQQLLEKIILDTQDYINAFSAINTIQAAAIVDEQGKQLLPGKDRLKSGVCGRAIKWAGIDMVKRLDALRRQHDLQFEIIGVGGVMTPADFIDYRETGADVVQSVTAAMWNQDLAAEIKATLK